MFYLIIEWANRITSGPVVHVQQVGNINQQHARFCINISSKPCEKQNHAFSGCVVFFAASLMKFSLTRELCLNTV